MRFVLIILGVLATVYVLLMLAAWAWQERIVWQPPTAAAGLPPGDSSATRITYTAEDGQPLHAFLVGDPQSARGLMIAFHGNAEVAAWNVAWAREVARRTGWAVWLPEYRGYGGLPGSPSYPGSALDARAAWRAAMERVGREARPVVLYGHSLGTAVATEVAGEHAPAALILLAPFTSVRDMARGMGGRPMQALWPWVGRVQFDTRARVATLDVPVSVAHGELDRVIPVRMGREVHAAARHKGELVILKNAGHNDVLITAPDEYWQWLHRALEAAR